MIKKSVALFITLLPISITCAIQEYVTDALRSRIPGLSLKIKPEELEEKTLLPYGFVQLANIWDSRQVFGTSQGLGSLFPQPKHCDRFGQDINAHPHFHMTVSPTLFGILMRGPSFTTRSHDEISTFAAIETDFRGAQTTTIGNLFMRHAFGMLNWQDGFLLMGQFWHPLIVPQCWPQVINYNGGAPFEPIARDPQARLVKRFENISFVFALASQSQTKYASNGPRGVSPEYIRNAVVPNLHVHLRAHGEQYLCGAAFDYKRLKPRLVSNKGINVHEHIDSFISEAYVRLDFFPVSLRMKGIWAQNANDQVMISGFGVKNINPVTDARTYANTATASGWIDASFYLDESKDNQLGIFAGYCKNLGSQERLFINPKTGRPIIYALLDVSQKIDDMFRLSPRLVIKRDPFLVGFELEYTQTSWGKPNTFGKVPNARPVGNIRFIAQINYIF